MPTSSQRPSTELLWKRHQRRPSAATRAALVAAYAHLVPATVTHLMRCWGDMPGTMNSAEPDDYIGAGNFGLLRAIDKFDPERGVKFETYAIALIRGQVREALRERDWAPRTVQAAIKALSGAEQGAAQQHLRRPTDVELAAHLTVSLDRPISEETVREWQRWFHQRLCYSAETPVVLDVPGDGDLYVADILDRSDPFAEPEAVDGPLLRRERAEALATALAALPERWADILVRWGAGESQKEIAEGLGVSESRVFQIRQQAFRRLRELGGLAAWDPAG